MFFGKKKKDANDYEDPVTRYGRMLRAKEQRDRDDRKKPSFLARIFGLGHDSDFVYHED